MYNSLWPSGGYGQRGGGETRLVLQDADRGIVARGVRDGDAGLKDRSDIAYCGGGGVAPFMRHGSGITRVHAKLLK